MKFQPRLGNLAAVLLLLAPTIPAFAQHYTRTDLTVDMAATSMSAPNKDPNLVNAWGVARSSTSPWWVSDNGTGLATLYDGTGAPQQLVVTVSVPKGANPPSAPTGAVFNPTTSFEVAPKQPAVFIFVTEDGTISGWNPNAKPTATIIKVNRSKHAIYKGVAIAQTEHGPRLFATNFQSGRVEVFDGGFHRIPADDDAFRDPKIEDRRDWAPFGIQNVGGSIIVTFAHRKPGADDEDHGPGLGHVAIFDTHGRFLGELQHGPWLNAPWGIVMSPSDFGVFSHRILIGNFGDGTINAFNVLSGKREGQLLDAKGRKLVIDGLWALAFGSGGGRSGLLNELFFTAGPNDEKNGLFGKITAVNTEQRGNTE